MECVTTFNAPYNLTKKELYEKVLSDIKAGNTGTINADLYRAYSENLKRAVSGVLQSGEYGSRYYDMQQQFEANVSRFSAYKAYHATQLLQHNSDPKVQKAILNTFNRYQAAEYNTSIARARTAKQWNDFNADPISNELYPNIMWLPSRSANPREEHRIFWNKVWAKNDPFWSQNQPGNLWNCKCDWEETDEPVSGGTYNYTPPAGLEGNPAETGEIFTDKASYFSKTTENEKEIIINKYHTITKKQYRESLKTLYGKTTGVYLEAKNMVSVEYNSRGINHLINDMRGDDRCYIKNQIISEIDKYLENGKCVAWALNDKPTTKPNAYKYYYFQITLPDGKPAFLTVEESIQRKFTLYSITNTLRQKTNIIKSSA